MEHVHVEVVQLFADQGFSSQVWLGLLLSGTCVVFFDEMGYLRLHGWKLLLVKLVHDLVGMLLHLHVLVRSHWFELIWVLSTIKLLIVKRRVIGS